MEKRVIISFTKFFRSCNIVNNREKLVMANMPNQHSCLFLTCFRAFP